MTGGYFAPITYVNLHAVDAICKVQVTPRPALFVFLLTFGISRARIASLNTRCRIATGPVQRDNGNCSSKGVWNNG